MGDKIVKFGTKFGYVSFGFILGLILMVIVLNPMSTSEAFYIISKYGVVQHDSEYVVVRITENVVIGEFYEACHKLSHRYEVVVVNDLQSYEH